MVSVKFTCKFNYVFSKFSLLWSFVCILGRQRQVSRATEPRGPGDQLTSPDIFSFVPFADFLRTLSKTSTRTQLRNGLGHVYRIVSVKVV